MANELQIRQQAQELEQALDQLKKTQTQLVQSAKMSSLEQLVAGVAHEINNPVNFIYANAEYAETSIEEIINIINLYQSYDSAPHPEIASAIAQIDLGISPD